MRILIAEDDPVSRRVLEEFLRRWGHEVIAVSNGADAAALLDAADAPRLAILDWMMPGMEGIEVCRRARARHGHPYTFLILLTALGQKQNLLEGLKAGADDYLAKPFHVEELRARLRVGERILGIHDELIAARDALHFQATHDLLTGLSSRGATLDFLAREVARLKREARPLSIVLLDLDHFKQINDRYGHLAGDAVLTEAAQRISKCVRSYDCVGRFGGEEFLIIFPGCSEEAAARQSERIRKSLQSAPVVTAGQEISVSASFGVSSADRNSADSAELLRQADAALYRAKELGRNRVERASSLAEISLVEPPISV